MARGQGKCRTEADLLGTVEVPDSALYGAHTERAVANFPACGHRTLGDYPALVEALMAVKQAVAVVNREAGFLPAEKADAIIAAARRVVHEAMFDQFPIHCLHGGGGTSANMNANEVLANLAEESLGGARGQYQRVHPNDHVNLHQSTNDVYPTACHIAVISAWPCLRATLTQLAETLDARASDLQTVARLARTCLQDAVDTSFRDLLSGYAAFVRRGRNRVDAAVDDLHAVGLGGTIVGRACDAPEAYRERIVPKLVEVTGDPKYRAAENLFDAAQNADPMVATSAQMDLLARGLIKIANDFRLMGSGPEAGFCEIRLPAVQAGSSIMPGKVNPVIPEFLMQVCFQVMGAHAACQATLDHAELDLNVWESTQVVNLLDAMDLLAAGVGAFDEKCVRGFEAMPEVNARNANSIVPLLTRLMHEHGYSKVSELCKSAAGDPARLRKLLEKGDLR
jgi:aspartate ammonia-lyase